MRLDFAPRKEIKDSLGFWIPRHGFRIPGTGFHSFQCNFDYGFHHRWDSGFLSLYSGFQSTGFRIKQQKFSQVQGFNKQISPRIPLHWAKTALMLQALTAGMVSILTLGRTCKLTPPPWYKGAGGGWSF